jgi:CubicO group peptidase (beta-lactamase class C family)
VLLDTYTDGIVVLHGGRCVYERYFGALRDDRPHMCFSVTKSYVGTLAATLLHEGVLDADRPVGFYLAELAGSAYADASLRSVLDMQVGVAFTEDYADPGSGFWRYCRAGGLRARPAGESGPDNYCEYLTTLRKEGGHERAFAYKSVNTEVLAWLLRRVTGQPLAELLSERIWIPIGCERDGYFCVDPLGVEMGGAGLSASLRDLARFGEMLRRDGDCAGRQVVPGAVVADIRRGGDPARFAKSGYDWLAGYSYRNMWWVSHNELGAFEARGIHGQRLYIAPRAGMVIARFASHPVAASSANDPITLPAFLALGRALGRS